MKKLTVLILLMSLMSTACNKSDGSDDPGTFYDASIYGDYSEDDPVPSEALNFQSNVTFVNFTASQREKMERAIEIIKLVVATDEFKNRILNYTYDGKKQFVDNGGYTNGQIYQLILNAAETLQPSKNNIMDAEVELYYENNNVVGYTYPNTRRIWVNTKYFNSYTAAGVAHNLFHEWLHKLGFTHAVNYTSSRNSSVPYAIGNIVGDIGRNFL
ncbi:hypothetical protein ACJVC5_19200 [Peredibacter sp. HCB2-198]|uniref:hypothetical protein n=1 Tax=Peredibacter sp. HCB2-198 TaxID=3383025 RepID=UPI0038B68F22